jgi:hypothetical protein
VILYRRPQRPLPRSVDGPWDWPIGLERRSRIARRARCAITVAPAWGISAGPVTGGPFGRAGPWELEAQDVERAYGPDRTIHVSLEEFARTLSVRRETRERFREGGVPARQIPSAVRRARAAHEEDAFRMAFERFRAFDRPNLLHLFATLRPDRTFAREFPAAVQTGPLWPARFAAKPAPPRGATAREWVWYASPASAEAIAPDVVAGLERATPPVRLYVRTPRPWAVALPRDRVEVEAGALRPFTWQRRFERAELRIVTGSRTLLEAIELGGPFLYFNGVLGTGRRRRRHRPEKIDALIDLGRRRGVSPSLLRDLADFAQGRRVAEVVARAAARRGSWARFPGSFRSVDLRPPLDDAGEVLTRLARELARRGGAAAEIVRGIREGSKG